MSKDNIILESPSAEDLKGMATRRQGQIFTGTSSDKEIKITTNAEKKAAAKEKVAKTTFIKHLSSDKKKPNKSTAAATSTNLGPSSLNGPEYMSFLDFYVNDNYQVIQDPKKDFKEDCWDDLQDNFGGYAAFTTMMYFGTKIVPGVGHVLTGAENVILKGAKGSAQFGFDKLISFFGNKDIQKHISAASKEIETIMPDKFVQSKDLMTRLFGKSFLEKALSAVAAPADGNLRMFVNSKIGRSIRLGGAGAGLAIGSVLLYSLMDNALDDGGKVDDPSDITDATASAVSDALQMLPGYFNFLQGWSKKLSNAFGSNLKSDCLYENALYMYALGRIVAIPLAMGGSALVSTKSLGPATKSFVKFKNDAAETLSGSMRKSLISSFEKLRKSKSKNESEALEALHKILINGGKNSALAMESWITKQTAGNKGLTEEVAAALYQETKELTLLVYQKTLTEFGVKSANFVKGKLDDAGAMVKPLLKTAQRLSSGREKLTGPNIGPHLRSQNVVRGELANNIKSAGDDLSKLFTTLETTMLAGNPLASVRAHKIVAEKLLKNSSFALNVTNAFAPGNVLSFAQKLGTNQAFMNSISRLSKMIPGQGTKTRDQALAESRKKIDELIFYLFSISDDTLAGSARLSEFQVEAILKKELRQLSDDVIVALADTSPGKMISPGQLFVGVSALSAVALTAFAALNIDTAKVKIGDGEVDFGERPEGASLMQLILGGGPDIDVLKDRIKYYQLPTGKADEQKIKAFLKVAFKPSKSKKDLEEKLKELEGPDNVFEQRKLAEKLSNEYLDDFVSSIDFSDQIGKEKEKLNVDDTGTNRAMNAVAKAFLISTKLRQRIKDYILAQVKDRAKSLEGMFKIYNVDINGIKKVVESINTDLIPAAAEGSSIDDKSDGETKETEDNAEVNEINEKDLDALTRMVAAETGFREKHGPEAVLAVALKRKDLSPTNRPMIEIVGPKIKHRGRGWNNSDNYRDSFNDADKKFKRNFKEEKEKIRELVKDPNKLMSKYNGAQWFVHPKSMVKSKNTMNKKLESVPKIGSSDLDSKKQYPLPRFITNGLEGPDKYLSAVAGTDILLSSLPWPSGRVPNKNNKTYLPRLRPRQTSSKVKEVKQMSKLDIRQLVAEVLNENSGQGYAKYPYESSVRDEEEPREDYIEEWKALSIEVIRDESRNTAIEIAKILVKDLELFEDVLDLAGQNQSIGTEILTKLKQSKEKA